VRKRGVRLALGEAIMTTMHLNGVAYDVQMAGDKTGNAPTLLLLHGFSGAADSWDAHIAALVAAGCYVVALDLLGHGRTAAPPDPARYAMRHAAADLHALLMQLNTRATVVGYSMGGRLALGLACYHPLAVTRLVLESASPGLASADERAARMAADEALAARIEAHGVPAFVDFWEQQPIFATHTAAQRAALRPVRSRHSAAGLAASLRGLGTGAQPSLWPQLPHLPMPVHLISGALDAKFTAINAQMAAQIPRVAHTQLAAGHTPHLERPAEWLAAVLAEG
jgi:2-succinyl-6-hydroxy-2,4-cyclohexadiene-1-carboxylate synthase